MYPRIFIDEKGEIQKNDKPFTAIAKKDDSDRLIE